LADVTVRQSEKNEFGDFVGSVWKMVKAIVDANEPRLVPAR